MAGKKFSIKKLRLRGRAARRRHALKVAPTTKGLKTTIEQSNLEVLLKDMNASLTSFADEMRRQNIWEQIVVVSVSDFGRTYCEISRIGPFSREFFANISILPVNSCKNYLDLVEFLATIPKVRHTASPNILSSLKGLPRPTGAAGGT